MKLLFGLYTILPSPLWRSREKFNNGILFKKEKSYLVLLSKKLLVPFIIKEMKKTIVSLSVRQNVLSHTGNGFFAAPERTVFLYNYSSFPVRR